MRLFSHVMMVMMIKWGENQKIIFSASEGTLEKRREEVLGVKSPGRPDPTKVAFVVMGIINFIGHPLVEMSIPVTAPRPVLVWLFCAVLFCAAVLAHPFWFSDPGRVSIEKISSSQDLPPTRWGRRSHCYRNCHFHFHVNVCVFCVSFALAVALPSALCRLPATQVHHPRCSWPQCLRSQYDPGDAMQWMPSMQWDGSNEASVEA